MAAAGLVSAREYVNKALCLSYIRHYNYINMTLPLSGVRVLDLSRVLAGPLTGMTLGDLGADVIKVERPGRGDESRGWGPPFDQRGESAYYLCCNRNKLSIALNYSSPPDRAVLLDLIAKADVVLENFRPGSLETMGIVGRDLLEQHPRLIWCHIAGFAGQPNRPGYDFVVQAECGWMSITGDPDGEPMKTGVALADVVTGKDAAIAILAALAARNGSPERTPAEDRWLEVSLDQSATSALLNVAQNSLVSGRASRRWGNAHANLVPYQLFRASDRSMVIAVGNDGQWLAACHVLGLDELARDQDLGTNAGRLAQRDRVVSGIAARLSEKTADHWLGALTAAGVPAGVVRTVEEALEDVVADPATGIAPSTGGTVRRTPPQLDEHGGRIREMGWKAFASIDR